MLDWLSHYNVCSLAAGSPYTPLLLYARIPAGSVLVYCSCILFKSKMQQSTSVYLKSSVLISSLWYLLWVFLLRHGEGKPFTHPHSKIASLGFMSKTASYNTIRTTMQSSLWCSAIVGAGWRTSSVCYITVAFSYVFASAVKDWRLVAIRSLIVPLVYVECACLNLQITKCLFSPLCCCVN